MKKINLKQIYDKMLSEAKKTDEDELEEDAMVVAGDSAGGLVSGPKGDTTTDILGKCKHNDGKGFFDKDCFHIPKSVFKKPLKRFDMDKKKKKDQIFLSDADNDDKLSDQQQKKLDNNEHIEKVKDYSKNVKNVKDVKKALSDYDKKKDKIEKSSAFSKVKDGINDIVSLLKDACSREYKVQVSTIAILTGVIVYVVSPVDIIPDVIPVVGVVDDVAVVTWALRAFKDALDNYRKWKKSQH